jgi:hypothetical protein
LACKRVPATASITIAAGAAMPANTDTLSHLPSIYKWTDGIDGSYNFMTRNSRVLYAR